LQVYCEAFAHNTVDVLPVRKPRPKIKDRYLLYTIYLYDNQTIIHQRQGNDIWKHLWEFPITETDEKGWQKQPSTPCIELKHQLSHQLLHARFYVQNVEHLPDISACQIVPINDLDNYAFSRLTLRALESLHIF